MLKIGTDDKKTYKLNISGGNSGSGKVLSKLIEIEKELVPIQTIQT